jgi:bifunctional non-homologous end joining protein LigD
MRARNFQEKLCELGRPEKIMFPGGFTRRRVADYYARAARRLLPHLRDRLVTLKRYPDGVFGEHFYEKDAPSFTPDWIETYPAPRAGGGPPINYILLIAAAAPRRANGKVQIEQAPQATIARAARRSSRPPARSPISPSGRRARAP